MDKTPSATQPGAGAPNVSLSDTGTELQGLIRDTRDSLWRLLDAVTGGAVRSSAITRTLGLDKSLSTRIVNALKQSDPLAVAAQIPSPEGLHLLCAAARRHVSAEVHAEALRCVDRFEEYIRATAGSFSTFRVMVAGWTPETREKLERESKYGVFKGMRQIIGHEADVSVSAYILRPGAVEGRADNIIVHGFAGWRRLRADAPLPRTYTSATSREKQENERWKPASLDGSAVDNDPASLNLSQFCSQPTPEYEHHKVNGIWQYSPRPLSLGRDGECSFYFAQRHEGSNLLHALPGRDVETLAVLVGIPSRVLLLDAFLHDDVWPGATPEVMVYRLGARGLVQDHELTDRAPERIALMERLTIMPRDPSSWHFRDVPRYGEMISHVFQRLQWPPEKFRCYRLRIEFPLCGTQIIMAYRLSPAR